MISRHLFADDLEEEKEEEENKEAEGPKKSSTKKDYKEMKTDQQKKLITTQNDQSQNAQKFIVGKKNQKVEKIHHPNSYQRPETNQRSETNQHLETNPSSETFQHLEPYPKESKREQIGSNQGNENIFDFEFEIIDFVEYLFFLCVNIVIW